MKPWTKVPIAVLTAGLPCRYLIIFRYSYNAKNQTQAFDLRGTSKGDIEVAARRYKLIGG